jgi:hypothetical protein
MAAMACTGLATAPPPPPVAVASSSGLLLAKSSDMRNSIAMAMVGPKMVNPSMMELWAEAPMQKCSVANMVQNKKLMWPATFARGLI